MNDVEKRIVKISFFAYSAFFLFFTFYNFNWGAPFYFHPDERNIASSVTQLKFPSNMNPHFFAYGSLPIYSVYFLGLVINFFTGRGSLNFNVGFEQAIILGRLFSTILTILIIPLIYKITVKISSKSAGVIASLLAMTSVAYFQFSHYATFEIWISFFSLMMSYLLLLFIENKKTINYILGSCIFGILCALKLSSVTLIPIFIYVIIISTNKHRDPYSKTKFIIKNILLLTFFSGFSYIISAPFNIIDKTGFVSSMNYEGSVATGTLPVFYTSSFFGTIPIIFQYQKILPFLINPLLTLLTIPTFFYICFIGIKKRNTYLGLLLLSLLCLFIPQSILFAKWTRYIVPSIAFFYIFLAIFILQIRTKLPQAWFKLFMVSLFIVSVLYGFSFIKTVRLSTDTRLQALSFAKINIPSDKKIMSEVYDLGITPFNGSYPNISLFNFYDLDNNSNQKNQLEDNIKNTNYIILPSQRILESRTLNKNKFPEGYKFYSQLNSGKLGFKMIYKTQCDIFCSITYLGNPVFNVEGTSNVFDRPTLFIYKKIN